MEHTEITEQYDGNEIAIIGMACRFPGSRTPEEFWRNLRGGVESITFFSDEELEPSAIDPAETSDPNYVKAAPVLDDVEMFDASFFGYTPREAEVMDPQHRLFLECAWEALEQAGYDPETYEGSVGIFGGARTSTYLFNVYSNQPLVRSLGAFQIGLGNDLAFLTARVAHKLNLKGPAYSVHTACSTSLVAIHVACQSLLIHECGIALAGGVAVNVPHRTGYMHQHGSILSPDGHCRAYDAEGQGTVFGSGAGLVVLKRLEDAIRDGDHIHAVIRGSAVNNDGSVKASFTAPGVYGQAEVIAEALANAGLTADEIGYVEGHGTGTALGDPVEVRALTKAFRASTDKKGYCALGSVKTNVGHLDAAAGVAGLIKAAFAVSRGEIPPTLHYRQSNPQIDFPSSPFYVNAELRQWERPEGGKRRAGISSFGVGGTNAHLIIEEAPEVREEEPEAHEAGGPRREVLTVSARTPEALAAACARLGEYLRGEGSRLRLADVAHTLQVGRRAFAHRAAVVCRTAEEAAESLAPVETDAAGADARPSAQTSAPAVWRGEAPSAQRPLIFLFSGQGVELAGSARSLYESEKEFARRLDECAAALLAAERAATGDDTQTAPAASEGEFDDLDVRAGLLAETGEQSDRWRQLYSHTRRAQPALFAYEYALSHLLISWGLIPSAAVGHSLGEYAAACVGGHLTLAEAASLVVSRARLMQEAPEGAMLAVGLNAEEAAERAAKAGLWVSAVNGERQSVVGGAEDAVERLRAELKAEGVGSQRLGVSRAFHTGLMTEAATKFEAEAGRLLSGGAASVGAVPVVSGVSGGWMRGGEAREAGYWARQMREPVRFWEALRTAAGGPAEGGGWAAEPVVIEVGPGVALSRVAQALAAGRGKETANGAGAEAVLAASVPAVPRPGGGDEATQVREAAARLWCWGVAPSWEKLAEGTRRRKVSLPTYPFERQRFWVSPTDGAAGGAFAGVSNGVGSAAAQQGAGRVPVREWLYLPSWRPTLAPPPSPSWDEGRGSLWLVFDEGRGLGGLVAAGLRDEGRAVAVVRRGTAFSHPAPGEYEVGEGEGDYERLMREAAAEAGSGGVRGVVHLWATAPRGPEAASAAAGAAGDGAMMGGEARAEIEEFEWAQRDGYYSLLRVARAAALCGAAGGVMEAVAVTAGMQAAGGEGGRAEMATALGVCKVAGQESEWARWAAVDVERGGGEGWAERAAGRVMAEVRGGLREAEVAWRGGRRWARSYEQVRLGRDDAPLRRFREGGVYLITGGLGGVGLLLAEHLASTVGARLVLTGRSSFPDKGEWQEWLAAHGEDDEVSRRIRRLQGVEGLGGEVLVARADVADEAQMRGVVELADRHFGALHGVIHAAGVTRGESVFAPVTEIGVEESAAQFAPKAHGVYVLERVLAGRELDFCLLMSSNAAVLGGLGLAAYSAANRFMDAFVSGGRGDGRTPWISADWDHWFSESDSGYQTGTDQFTMTTAEGLEAFERVVSYVPEGQVVVATGSLPDRLRTWVDRDASARAASAGPAAASHPRPNVSAPYKPPQDEDERTIAGVWAEVLGVEQVGSADNFFELGGHSLQATTVVTRLRAAFRVDLPLKKFFEDPTVSGLARTVRELRGDGEDADEAEVLKLLSQLSDEEVDAEIRRMTGGGD